MSDWKRAVKERLPGVKYPAITLAENWFGGQVSLGRVTLYGANAMHYGIQIRCRTGYFCFRLPFRCFGTWWPLYCYFSPNATPWAATWWGWGRVSHGGYQAREQEEGNE